MLGQQSLQQLCAALDAEDGRMGGAECAASCLPGAQASGLLLWRSTISPMTATSAYACVLSAAVPAVLSRAGQQLPMQAASL